MRFEYGKDDEEARLLLGPRIASTDPPSSSSSSYSYVHSIPSGQRDDGEGGGNLGDNYTQNDHNSKDNKVGVYNFTVGVLLALCLLSVLAALRNYDGRSVGAPNGYHGKLKRSGLLDSSSTSVGKSQTIELSATGPWRREPRRA